MADDNKRGTIESAYIQFGDWLVEASTLSEETIEWLTWYNSLETAEQAAISAIPADLLVSSKIILNEDGEAFGANEYEKP